MGLKRGKDTRRMLFASGDRQDLAVLHLAGSQQLVPLTWCCSDRAGIRVTVRGLADGHFCHAWSIMKMKNGQKVRVDIHYTPYHKTLHPATHMPTQTKRVFVGHHMGKRNKRDMLNSRCTVGWSYLLVFLGFFLFFFSSACLHCVLFLHKRSTLTVVSCIHTSAP